MRKRFLPLLAVIAAFAVLAGCGSTDSSSATDTASKEKVSAQEIIVGRWEAALNMTYLEEKLFNNEKELEGYFIPESFELPMVFEFSEDGKYAVSLESDKVDSQIAVLTEKLKGALTGYFTDAFSLENADALDKFLKEQKISIDEMAQDILDKNAFKKTVYGVEYGGVYLTEDDKCFFGKDGTELDSFGNYMAFEIKSKTEMSIVEIVTIEENDAEILKNALPITIKKR